MMGDLRKQNSWWLFDLKHCNQFIEERCEVEHENLPYLGDIKNKNND